MRVSAALLLLTSCRSHTATTAESRASEHVTAVTSSHSETATETRAWVHELRTEGPERIEETVTSEEQLADLGADVGRVLRRTVTHRVIERGQVVAERVEEARGTASVRAEEATAATRAAEAESRSTSVRDVAPAALAWGWVWGGVGLLLLVGGGLAWLRRA